MPLWAGLILAATLGIGILLFGASQFKAARKRGIKELRTQGELLPHKAAAARGPDLRERRRDAFRRTMTRLRTMRFNLADLQQPAGGSARGSAGGGRRSSTGGGGSGRGGRRDSASAPARLGRGSSVAPARGVKGRIPSFEELGRTSTRR